MKTRQSLLVFITLTAALLLLNFCSGGNTPIRVGDTISPFSATTLDNNTFSLSSHMGRPVIVRFFLVDCPYCRADTPIFNKFYQKYRGSILSTLIMMGTTSTQWKTLSRSLTLSFRWYLIRMEKLPNSTMSEFNPSPWSCHLSINCWPPC